MARLFGGATTDRVIVGPNAAINNLTAFTVGLMVYPTALATGNRLVAKAAIGPNAGWYIDITGTDKPEIVVFRAVSPAGRSSTTALTINNWWTVVGTVDMGASPVTHLYLGVLGSDMAEPGYSVSQDGSGAQSDDSLGSLAFGNGSWAGATNATTGLVANGFVTDRVYSLADAQEFHKGRLPLPCRPLVHWPIWGQSATEPDLSRSGLHGTVEGATGPADNPPQMKWRPSIIRAGIPGAGAAVFSSRVVTRRHRRK